MARKTIVIATARTCRDLDHWKSNDTEYRWWSSERKELSDPEVQNFLTDIENRGETVVALKIKQALPYGEWEERKIF